MRAGRPRLGRARLQVEKARKRYRGRDIEQLLAQKRGRAVELERVAETDIACYGSWTPQEIAIALDRSISRAEAARRLGRSFRAIKRIRDLQRQKASGLIPARESRAEPIRQRLWTEDEIAVLADESRTPTEIAAELGRSINSVTVARARWLGRLQGRTSARNLHRGEPIRMPMSALPGRGRGRTATTPRGHPAHGGQLQGALDRLRYRDRARPQADRD